MTDTDSIIDSLFQTFRLPHLHAGELCGTDCKPRGESEWHQVGNLFTSVDPLSVYAVSIREMPMQNCPAHAFQKIIKGMSEMKSMHKLNANSCGMSKEQAIQMFRCVAALPNFIQPRKDVSLVTKTTTELYSELQLGGNGIDDAFFRTVVGVESPLNGVSKLVLSDNPVTDESLPCIAASFPRLSSLHLEDTQVEGRNTKRVIREMKSLLLIGLDRSRAGAEGADAVLGGMQARSKMLKHGAKGIEVRMRNVQDMNDKWIPLLDFASKPSNVNHFCLRHSLQVGLGDRPVHKVTSHPEITVVLYLSGEEPIPVVHTNVVSCKTVIALSNEVVDELNLVCDNDDRTVNDRMVMGLRNKYREALMPLLLKKKLFEKRFKIGSVVLKSNNRYTKETKELDVSHTLIGSPDPSWDLTLEVEAEER
jgi:hypothetical protein